MHFCRPRSCEGGRSHEGGSSIGRSLCAAFAGRASQFLFPGLEQNSERTQVHSGHSRFGKHAAEAFFFLHMVLDHLGQHLDPCVEQWISAGAALDLLDEPLRALVLDEHLVVQVFVARRLDERGIEDLLFDARVNLQCPTYLLGEALFFCGGLRALESLEQALDLAMIGLEKLNCFLGSVMPAARFTWRTLGCFATDRLGFGMTYPLPGVSAEMQIASTHRLLGKEGVPAAPARA